MREKIINKLIYEMLQTIVFDTEPLEIILTKGFKGYNNYSLHELFTELNATGNRNNCKKRRQKIKKLKARNKTT